MACNKNAELSFGRDFVDEKEKFKGTIYNGFAISKNDLST